MKKFLTASLNLNQGSVRFISSTQTKILILQLAWAKIRAKQKSAKALNKNGDLFDILKCGSKTLQSRL